MRKIGIGLFLMISFLGVQAQDGRHSDTQVVDFSQEKVVQFSGVVVNSVDLSSVPFVTVSILNKHRGTVADANGFFNFVAVTGDTVRFSSVSYKSVEIVIPDTISYNYYSIVQSMSPDTMMLAETVIYPWPSKEKFREEFVNLELPKSAYDVMRENFNLSVIRERVRAGKMDAAMNYKSLAQSRVDQLYHQGQYAPNNLLNPFAWAQFVKKWKKQNQTKQQEKNRNQYQEYEEYE